MPATESLQNLRTKCSARGAKFSLGGDAKDSDDFSYMGFSHCPSFSSEYKSAMAKTCTPELFERLRHTKTSKGYTLSNAIQTGCLLPHLRVGCTAGDEESWSVFKDLYYPVILELHGYDANTQQHPTDLDSSKLVFSAEQSATFERYVASTRIRAARNITGFALPCGSTSEERAGVEEVLREALTSITDPDLRGTYCPLDGISHDTRDVLRSKGCLFEIPSEHNYLMAAGAARDWPRHRGIFHNDDQTALVWCNEEDHCCIISMKMGGDIPGVFERFSNLSKILEATGAKFMWNETLGYMGTCPSNLGTGMLASMTIQLKCFNKLLEDPTSPLKDKELLGHVCAQFGLQAHGSAGEHSAAKDAKFDVSNKQRLGVSEVELVQKMIDGVTSVIEVEELLAAGATLAEVRAKTAVLKKKRALQNLRTKCSARGAKFSLGGDAKDSDDFSYMGFSHCPSFSSEYKSAMAKTCTPELFERLRHTKTSKGYTLSNAIQTGCLLPHLRVGCTAGDEESWSVFKDLYYPVILELHGYDANTQQHPTDLDSSKLVFSAEQSATFERYVASTRIRAARNITGFALPCGSTSEERAGVEEVLREALTSITDPDLRGTYCPLDGISHDTRDVLRSKGCLFEIPSEHNYLMAAGAARDWPRNRGIFHNDDQTALVWCNEEDHCCIISMKMGGDIPGVFERFSNLSKILEATGAKFMWNETLGYMGTCPSNLGTGMLASMTIQLKCFNKLLEDPTSPLKDKELLGHVCAQFGLQAHGSAGEHSAAKDAKFDVSNKQRLGVSEVELVQKMIDGVTKLIALEELLAVGITPSQIRAAAGIQYIAA